MTCSKLIQAAESTPGTKGMFLNCQEFTYYGAGTFGKTPPWGCHCASWTVNCPFETCPVGTAFDDVCLAAKAKKLGFSSLSKLSNFVNPASVPKALRPYTVHPDYISTCMYWLPKPPNPSLPAVNTDSFAVHLPKFATFYFDSPSLFECSQAIDDEDKFEATKAGLVKGLGQPGLSVLSITCGTPQEGTHAIVTGPADQMDKAAKLASNPTFCFQASNIQMCTLPLPPGAIPGAPGPAPGAPGAPAAPFAAPAPAPFAAAPGPVPSAFLPVLARPPAPAAAPAPGPALGAPAGAAPGGAPSPGPGGAPSPGPGPAPAR